MGVRRGQGSLVACVRDISLNYKRAARLYQKLGMHATVTRTQKWTFSVNPPLEHKPCHTQQALGRLRRWGVCAPRAPLSLLTLTQPQSEPSLSCGYRDRERGRELSRRQSHGQRGDVREGRQVKFSVPCNSLLVSVCEVTPRGAGGKVHRTLLCSATSYEPVITSELKVKNQMVRSPGTAAKAG